MLFIHNVPSYDKGFLQYPMAVVRRCGVLARALAALYAVPSIRSKGFCKCRLDRIAAYGCLPERTFKRQLDELESDELRIVKRENREFRGRVRINVDLAFLQKHYGKGNRDILRIDRQTFRDHPQLGFPSRILLAFYRYRCHAQDDAQTHSYCYETFDEIAAKLGLSAVTWRRAAGTLAGAGLIERDLLPNSNYAVWIPGNRPEHEPGTLPAPEDRLAQHVASQAKRLGLLCSADLDASTAMELLSLCGGSYRDAFELAGFVLANWRELGGALPVTLAELLRLAGECVGMHEVPKNGENGDHRSKWHYSAIKMAL
jgi:hypothetical protein